MNQDGCENGNCDSTQFSQTQKNQILDQQKRLERYCTLLHVFGFNNAKADFNSIKSYLLAILVNERDIKSNIIKKTNQFISIKTANAIGSKFLAIGFNEFFGGATCLDSILKAYKTSKAERFFPYKRFD